MACNPLKVAAHARVESGVRHVERHRTQTLKRSIINHMENVYSVSLDQQHRVPAAIDMSVLSSAIVLHLVASEASCTGITITRERPQTPVQRCDPAKASQKLASMWMKVFRTW